MNEEAVGYITTSDKGVQVGFREVWTGGVCELYYHTEQGEFLLEVGLTSTQDIIRIEEAFMEGLWAAKHDQWGKH